MPVFLRLMKIVKKLPVRSAVSIRQHPANTQSEAIRNAQQAILAEVVNVTKILILHQAASPSSSCRLPFPLRHASGFSKQCKRPRARSIEETRHPVGIARNIKSPRCFHFRKSSVKTLFVARPKPQFF